MKCPNCGTVNPPGEEFCENCGLALTGAASSGTSTTGANNIAVLSHTGNTNPGVTTGGGTSGSPRTLAPGSQLENGRYVVQKILGQGGMGAAVLVKDTRVADKLVVIKELIADSTDPQQRQEDVNNFRREVKTLTEIDHPLVPTVTDSFQERSRYFMVQEYVAGENLEDHMDRIKKPMPEREALTYASQVLDILDYLSNLKPPIVHRDIKPANIIIGSKDKRAHLVDFGIARAEEAKNAQRKQTAALGTPGYAPPEQYQGNADPRSDLYALAATLHHLLTNRDPRDFPPFIYPPARSLNPQLTPDIEGVLAHALQINVNNRYQTAAEMKRDIDEILAKDFGFSGDTSTYTLGASGPIVAPRQQPNPRTPLPSNAPVSINRARPAQPVAPVGGQRQMGTQTPYPPPQAGAFGRPPAQRKQRGNNYVIFSFVLLLLVVAVIAAAFFILPNLNKGGTGAGGTGGATATSSTPIPTLAVSNDGTGTTNVNGEQIGISSGATSFDASHSDDGSLMSQAATAFAAGNVGSAQSLWQAASNKATDDAEPLIYLENQRVKTSGVPYITLIVGTMLTGSNDRIQVGHDSLQGAYVAQKQFNANNGALLGGVEVRLLIANSGSDDVNGVKAVANQIVAATQKDKTIVGVMGWPYSGQTVNAVNILGPAKIPMVSSTASSNQLSGVSPYFFRVAPPDKSQAAVGALYAKNKLHATNVALFVDQSDSYSSSLANGFNQQFTQAGGKVTELNYTVGKASSISSALQQVLSSNPQPDLIYFAGYSSDVGTLLTNLPESSKLQVLGGDALYNLAGYPGVGAKFNRLRFTAFSYPDQWAVLGKAAQQPAFYKDYPATFNPNNAHQGNPYGFTRAGYNVVLAYDATLALLNGSKNGLGGQMQGLTPDKLKTGLASITGSKAIQGASGQIAFDPNTGDPVNKVVLILAVSQDGHIMMEGLGAGNLLNG
ncbi:MAG: ABC transporter substrate-binding protein [Chloroflexota bacterium]|nr:ABC transporter substrate-binding protein [Chloroflexota bacterium]